MKTAITQARVALSQWEQRIAPVFDVARQLQLVEIADGQVRQTSAGAFSGDFPMERALYLRDWRADTLLCGAISRPVHEMIGAYGIRVVPFVAGEIDEVLQAWLDGMLASDRFAMPGRGAGFCGGADAPGYASGAPGRGLGMRRGGGKANAATSKNHRCKERTPPCLARNAL